MNSCLRLLNLPNPQIWSRAKKYLHYKLQNKGIDL